MFSCGQAPQRQEKNLNRQQIEQLARIQLPPNSKEIEVHTESGIDSLIVLRFTLDQSDLDSFLTSAGYTEPLKEGFRPFTRASGCFLVESRRGKRRYWWISEYLRLG